MAIKNFTVSSGVTAIGTITGSNGISGDMDASSYDPQLINGDAFLRSNHTGSEVIDTGETITITDAPVADTHATNKLYVDTTVANNSSTDAATLSGKPVTDFVTIDTPVTIRYPTKAATLRSYNTIEINSANKESSLLVQDSTQAARVRIYPNQIAFAGSLNIRDEYYVADVLTITSHLSNETSNTQWAPLATVTLGKDPVGALEAATKQYVDNSVPSGVEFTANKNTINGYAGLDGAGLINSAQLPLLAITSTFVVASELAQLALTVQEGDVAVRSDLNVSFIALNATNGTIADWQQLLTPTDVVLSVAGKTGAVTLASTDLTDGATLIKNTGPQSINDVVIMGTTGAQIRTSSSVGTSAIIVSNDLNIALELRGASTNSNQLFLNATDDYVGIGKVPSLGELDVSGTIWQSGNQVIDTSGGQSINNSLTIANSNFRSWSSVTDPSIYAALGGLGTTGGNVIEGQGNSHLVIAIKDDDIQDSFAVVGTGGTFGTNNDYDTLLFQLKSDGTAKIAAGDIVHTGGGQTINGSLAVGTADGRIDLNTLGTASGVTADYWAGTGVTNFPVAVGGSLLHTHHDAGGNFSTQLYINQTGDDLSWRGNNNGVWSPWKQAIHTEGGQVVNGSLGVNGELISSTVDWNTLTTAGVYIVESTTSTNSPSDGVMFNYRLEVKSIMGSSLVQKAYKHENNFHREFTRQFNTTAVPQWTPWHETIHSGGGQTIDTGLTINGTLYNFTGGHTGLSDNTFSGILGDIVLDDTFVASKGISDAIFYNTLSSAPMQKTIIGVLVDAPQKIAFDMNADTYEGVPGSLRDLTDIEIQTVLTDYDVIGFNAVGEGLINVIGENGNIQAGDYIVTSNTAGKGMRQTDDIYRNYTVAKARESVTFSSTGDVQLIACVYLCG